MFLAACGQNIIENTRLTQKCSLILRKDIPLNIQKSKFIQFSIALSMQIREELDSTTINTHLVTGTAHFVFNLALRISVIA